MCAHISWEIQPTLNVSTNVNITRPIRGKVVQLSKTTRFIVAAEKIPRNNQLLNSFGGSCLLKKRVLFETTFPSRLRAQAHKRERLQPLEIRNFVHFRGAYTQMYSTDKIIVISDFSVESTDMSVC
eukprot:TRINITY_DN1514_c2_g1_i10.p3 TRINITY_DN1514_c2_g1~~TRINITY_DN1514_c2_g1_i10.p3  ORF type:complete len:126 (+),score=6.01 TRINITY_DN1514_c2_g1_i10:1060-1437(+)